MSITYTIGVASPLRETVRARAAQRVLNGDNVFGIDFHRGQVDGVFGEETGRSCIRAKFWLGYPTKELTPKYGPFLDAYLHGTQQPDEAMLKRQALREKKAAETPLRMKALKEAKKHIGVKESPPESNIVLFSKWYGVTGPWCAMYTTYCYVKAGSKGHVRGSRWAYVPYIVADARAGRHGLQVTRDPKPGDLVCFDWDGGVADHVGLFQEWLAGAEGSEFRTCEGNTSVGNDSNGGEVMERTRRIAQVECFVRVGR
jgi:hypothetical protein